MRREDVSAHFSESGVWTVWVDPKKNLTPKVPRLLFSKLILHVAQPLTNCLLQNIQHKDMNIALIGVVFVCSYRLMLERQLFFVMKRLIGGRFLDRLDECQPQINSSNYLL